MARAARVACPGNLAALKPLLLSKIVWIHPRIARLEQIEIYNVYYNLE